LKFIINFFRASFLSILFLIRRLVLIFSFYYLSGDISLRYYFLILFIFIFRMALLVLRNNYFILFISWDGLGVRRFFLVLYYLNTSCVSRSIITFISNRIGDILLFWWTSWYLFYNVSLNYYLLIFSRFSLLLSLSLTKSAQYPFCSWLPKAIRAPTPIRALVHSSTLVTAGIFILLKFSSFFFYLERSFILLLGLFTLFYAGRRALFERDLKRIVALSTLSQIGLLFLGLYFKCFYLTLFHLISHAIFKRSLFIQFGFLIHNFYNSQESRIISSFSRRIVVRRNIFISLVCLCGIYFSSGYISKELLLYNFIFTFSNLFFFLFFIVSIFITFIYTLRILKVIYNRINVTLFINQKSSLFIIVSFILSLSRVLICWIFFNNLYLFNSLFITNWEGIIPLIFLISFLLITKLSFFIFYTPLSNLFYTDELLLISRKQFFIVRTIELLVRGNVSLLFKYLSRRINKISLYFINSYPQRLLVLIFIIRFIFISFRFSVNSIVNFQLKGLS